MSDSTKPYPVCGFVPPYILQAVAASGTTQTSLAPGSVTEELDEAIQVTSAACKATLEHSLTCKERYSAACAHHAHAGPSLQQPLGISAPAAAAAGLNRKIYNSNATGTLRGTLAISEGAARIKDRQIMNTYDGFKITYDFYMTVFGRNSLDNAGLPLIGNVHYKPSSSPNGFNNAFWDGEQMVFGDGDHVTFDYLTDSLDVIAHELTHGFVQYSSPLTYQGQSGALNESCADVFAAMTEQWHMKQVAADADWILGQTLFPVAFTGSALRSFKASKAYENDPVFGTDPQPKHMKDLYNGTSDNGGVHVNSGIPNHAFYLAALAVGGHSWESVGKVWYAAMTSGKVKPECNFKTFAEITVEVAAEEIKEKIKEAWVKVGVLA